MSVDWIDRVLVERTADAWAVDAEMIGEVGRALRGQSVAAMPPSVTGAATAFLVAWGGYADQSAEIAAGMSTTLRSILDDYFLTDDEAAAWMADLDGALGPRR